MRCTTMIKLAELDKFICDYIKANWRSSMNEPVGTLKYKFLDPAADYRGQLWDWDSFFCGMALIDVYDDTADYLEGCVRNFIDNQADDGSIPYMIDVGGKKDFTYALPISDRKNRDSKSELNSIKPLLAQMAKMVYEKKKDISFYEDIYPALRRHIWHWENTQITNIGLFVWRSQRGSGTDNHPAVYGRPLNSSMAVELNCFMFLEYSAMSSIANEIGKTDDSKIFYDKACILTEKINSHMWDPVDEIYYHLDAMSKDPKVNNQKITWDVPLKFKTWTSFVPMYAEIAPKHYADLLVKKHLLNKDEFWSEYGVRTMAKNEPAYNTAETSNPSNWQGPIWIISTYIVFKGLLNYGYINEARKIAENVLKNLYRDICENGAMHEYYNPETGKSDINLGFMNWNALAGLMIKELHGYEKGVDKGE